MASVARVVVAVSLLAVLWPGFVAAQKAGVVTTLEGNVTAARAAAPQPVALKFKDDVFVNDRVVTGDRSLARLLLGGKAVVTVRERSALTITEIPGRSIIDLDSGKIAVAVAKDRMRPGEQVEVKTPNAIAAVRGTVFVVEVVRASADASQIQAGVTTNVFAFRGALDLSVGAQNLRLLAGNFASLTGAGVTSGVITPEVQAGALGGLSARTPAVRGADAAAKTSAMDATVATFSPDGLPDGTGTPPAWAPPLDPPRILPGNEDLRPDMAKLTAPGETVTPASISIASRPAVSTPLGPVVDGGLVTDQYRSVGLVFGPAPAAIFDDGGEIGPALAWAGVNVSNTIDLISPVEASLVMPGTNTAATTGRLSVEVGFSPEGSILLEAFGSAGVLLGSTTNDDGIGPHGRTLATLDLNGIRSFRVSGDDTWGITQIEYGDLIDPPGIVTVQGPLLRATHEERQAFSTFLDMTRQGVVGEGVEPLIWLTGSTFTTAHQFALLSNSDVTSGGSFVRLDDGSRVVQTGGAEPLIWMRGGSLSVGTAGAGGNLFELIGRPGTAHVDAEAGLTLGTDRSLAPGAEAPVFETDNGAVVDVRGSAYKVDSALLEATAPLLNLKSGAALTATGHVVDLTRQAKVSVPNDAVAMVSLDAGTLKVLDGHLVNVAGGSALSVAGTLVSLANGSTLTLLNGVLLNVSGGSHAAIGRSLVSFSGTGNVLNVANSLAPTAILNGIPVAGAVDSVRIGADALAGLGASGTITINGVPLTSATPLASLTGSLLAVQSGGAVRIGP